jgi:hypothetical protein
MSQIKYLVEIKNKKEKKAEEKLLISQQMWWISKTFLQKQGESITRNCEISPFHK